MINYTTEKVYKWEDIQLFLCEKIGIELQYFTSYHKIVGGDHKNLWHVWLDITRVEKDTICFFYFPEDDNEYTEWYVWDEYGEWITPLINAIKDLHQEVGCDEILISYSW